LGTALITVHKDSSQHRASLGKAAVTGRIQQSGLLLHRTRHLFIRQQTAVINAIRADFAEFGIVAPVGRRSVELWVTKPISVDGVLSAGFGTLERREWAQG
jgi:hypothetical protein